MRCLEPGVIDVVRVESELILVSGRRIFFQSNPIQRFLLFPDDILTNADAPGASSSSSSSSDEDNPDDDVE